MRKSINRCGKYSTAIIGKFSTAIYKFKFPHPFTNDGGVEICYPRRIGL